MIKIKTELLKNMTAKVIKLCTYDNLLPLTSLIELQIEKDMLILTSTNNLSTLELSEKAELAGVNDITKATIEAKLFGALISKLTSEFTNITIEDKKVVIDANGVYELAISIDENGESIKFPKVNIEENIANKEFNFKDFANNLKIAASATPEDMNIPELYYYYLKEKVYATDTTKMISIENLDVMKNDEIFIRLELGTILMDLDFGLTKFYIKDGGMYLFNNNFKMNIMFSENSERFPTEGINKTLQIQLTNAVKINRNQLVALLDRLSLFVSEYEKNSVDLNFGDQGVTIISKKKTGNEYIKYNETLTGAIQPFNCTVNIKYLKDLVSALSNDELLIKFGGADNLIRFEEKEIIQILSLVDEEYDG